MRSEPEQESDTRARARRLLESAGGATGASRGSGKRARVFLRDGFGNQLMQYLFAESFLVEHELSYDTSALRADKHGRRFELQGLGCAPSRSLFAWWRMKLSRALRLRSVVGDASALLRPLPDRIDVYGWFQEGLPHEGIASSVREKVVRGLLPDRELEPRERIFAHYRDYAEVARPVRSLGPERFAAAILATAERTGVAEVSLHSLSSSPLALPGLRVTRPDPTAGPREVLADALSSRHLVLSNSSLSWAAGFLHPSASSVLYPAREGLTYYPEPLPEWDQF